MTTPPRSDAFVFFGATGDLAYKQIFPALQALIRRDHFDLPIVGVAKGGGDVEALKARAKDSLEKHGNFDAAAYAKLCERLAYIDGDYNDPATYTKIREALGKARHPLHYFAIPPSMFATVAGGLAKAGCADGARVVVEKPFGHDLASATALNKTLHEHFPEEAIFRIDHFLGKEPVQNLSYFRAANPSADAGWNRAHIASVQITMAEKFGVAGRGGFYDAVGAVRDVVQNHMLEVIACLAMESAASTNHEDRRDERSALLKAIRTLDPSCAVRGQFRGYASEPGVAPGSKTETFAAMRFDIDNERWKGVPFFVRVGKCLPVTATEVLMRFKRYPRPVLDEPGPPPANYYRFQLGPKVVIALGANVKKPGELMEGELTELIAHQQHPGEMEPYERLLGDAAHGDGTLFAREDSVEESWRIVDPILGSTVPVYEYEPGTWGPREVIGAVVPEGGWHDPEG